MASIPVNSSRRQDILAAIASLKQQVLDLEAELRLLDATSESTDVVPTTCTITTLSCDSDSDDDRTEQEEDLEQRRARRQREKQWSNLSRRQIERYGRQLMIPEVGVIGQQRMNAAKVLIVGVGGLGCPVALLLAAAGIGKLALVDPDTVALSNLHRQILHSEFGALANIPKVLSAKTAIQRINTDVKVSTYAMQITPENAVGLFEQYDIVVDCTDNVATRYLVNDACVLANRPLVYGSAIRTYGQVAVYHYTPTTEPNQTIQPSACYRCIHPRSMSQGAGGNCSDEGVLGPVTSIIGSIQAMEVIKIIIGHKGVLSSRMLLVDASAPSFRIMNFCARRDDCAVCGNEPSITRESFCSRDSITAYTQKCSPTPLSLLDSTKRVTVATYSDVIKSAEPHFLLDVREPLQYQICHLPNAINIPLRQLATSLDQIPRDQPLYVICRRGNQSQRAVVLLREKGFDSAKDIIGGMVRWTTDIDPNFPIY